MRSFPLGLPSRVLAALALVLLAAGCSSDDQKATLGSSTGADGGGSPDSGTGYVPTGPTAKVVKLLTGGKGLNLAAARPDPLPSGWVEEEYEVQGTAVSYASAGDAALPADGTYALREDQSADYRTRIVVRRPGTNADFNGTVVVEWLNVSGGVDANPDYAYTSAELFRGGYVWIGVSAQLIGIEGGQVLVSTPVSDQAGAGKGLRVLDPDRYSDLHHPGDAFAYDLFTQVGRLARVPEAAGGVLGDLAPKRVLGIGESQSAFMLTTYVDGIHPLAHAFDGFLLHSRGGGAPPLGEAGKGIDLLQGLGAQATRIRTDLAEPVLMMETETDLLYVINYFPARQDDSDKVHTWEIAGTAHADAYLLGDIGATFGCPKALNAGPGHFVAKSALRHLDQWVRTGEAPPTSPRLDVQGSPPSYAVDGNGNVTGGIRTPEVDVPVDTLSGAPPGGSIACQLFGSTTPLPADRLATLYSSAAAYTAAYGAAADSAVQSGFVLPEDKDALLADAHPDRIAP
ncbi:MAG TPA: alpha/beta hydrolase domain-containing protein [Polyangiaceae bacterium]|nr:alpha/beta hydrolase domain-containing protein [Polyangiaceae bacterium]